jgi:proteasome lid subunit RPN8/RPN11
MLNGGLAWSADFPATNYFSDVARLVVASQQADGRLAAGERVRFAISAFDVGDAEAAGPALRFAAVDRAPSAPVRDRAFPDLVAQSRVCGEAHGHDMEVVLPAALLDEVCALTHEAGDRETGGILLGHLCRDEPPRAVGVEVTTHIPARHTVGDAMSLTFTSDTWTDVRAAVALRRADELIVGWWHSHPAHAWCAGCPPDRQRVCRFAVGRLSSDDRALHRAMFPSAFSLALLVTRSIAGLDTTLFGWRGGVLTQRGFRLRGPAARETRRSIAGAALPEAHAEPAAACPSESGRARARGQTSRPGTQSAAR